MSETPSTVPLVFVVRMSAIGDILLACQTVREALAWGVQAIPVVGPGMHGAVFATTPVKWCLEAHSNELRFFMHSNSQISQCDSLYFRLEFLEKSFPVHAWVLDLQKTGRSRRAVALLETIEGISWQGHHGVSKRSLFRFFLIFVAFFRSLFYGQRSLGARWRTNGWTLISDLNRQALANLIGKIPEHQRHFIGTLPVFPAPPPPSPASQLEPTLGDYIVLMPGASLPLKSWPKENYRLLKDLILEHTQSQVVLLGAAGEKDVAAWISWPENPRVFNLTGQLPLNKSLNTLAHARHVVTGDSFASHACSTFGVSASVLFGSTTPAFGFAPQNKNIHIHWMNLACSPCTRHGRGECRYRNLKCLKGISAEEVFEDILKKT